MKKELDKIQFESRTEVREILKMIEEYNHLKGKNNRYVKELHNLLDAMEMEW